MPLKLAITIFYLRGARIRIHVLPLIAQSD
jgi:hypothetical protein